MASTEKLLLQELNLPSCLNDRILCRVPPPPSVKDEQQNPNDSTIEHAAKRPFVLYLPTVVLRKKHNPAFSLACRLANHYGIPLVVLITVLDDQHLSQTPLSPIAMTSRRLAFVLEALKDTCCSDWESHGFGVAIRVHGPGSRNPHHLSLAHAARAVVSDEPFVDPYREYVRRITRTCRAASVPFWTVDGSTSVPPNAKLVRKANALQHSSSSNNAGSVFYGDIAFCGAPSKAWRWEKQTDSVRKHHVYGAYREKALDAPELQHKLPKDFFLDGDDHAESDKNNSGHKSLLAVVPSKWKDREANAPGQRPWCVTELCQVSDCKEWALAWNGADSSVPPCKQTHGSVHCAKSRWKAFVNVNGLKNYAKKRNSITSPHAVSRISCYLNLGILSIFDVLNDVWEAKVKSKGYATGCQKFLDEVGKWREGSYVHAFANPNYHTTTVLPPWAIRHLESLRKSSGTIGNNGYDYDDLEGAATRDETWNAMQAYLIDTGELHNNARMTWGKTVVHWLATRISTKESLWQLCCLNDRFALDGLSPPSYGGVLWCYGWQDKPTKGNQVSEKWASRYRTGASGFVQAKEELLQGEPPSSASVGLLFRNSGGKRKEHDGNNIRSLSLRTPSPATKKARSESDQKKKDSNSILSYFGPTSTGARQIG